MAVAIRTPANPPVDVLFRSKELIDSDGEPLDSDWHLKAMNLLIDSVTHHRRGRTDYYCGGNMFIYYQKDPPERRKFRGPDFFFVEGVELRPRRFWVVWEEGGRFPDMIMEILSPRTARIDLTVKKDIYEQKFRTPEYVCYDPAKNKLHGWRLVRGRFQPITPNDQGWLWSERLQLWVGTWVGEIGADLNTWARFYDAQGRLVLTREEALSAEVGTLEAEVAHLKARLAEAEGKPPVSRSKKKHDNGKS